jgi:phosphoglycerate dehydrogenase-like enzyme
MRSVICVHERFEQHWPFSADHWHQRWQSSGGCELYRTEDAEARAPQLVPDPGSVQRLVLLGFPADPEDLEPFSGLEECYHEPSHRQPSGGIEAAAARGVSFIPHRHDVYWGQSVSEFALGLTISALRRIPQTYTAMMQGHEVWDYSAKVGRPGQRGGQFGDDPNFVNGTLAGKRVRVVGAGNIGGRFASFCSALGAQVAMWDPFAPDAPFVLAGAERRFHLSEMMPDAEIFAAMVPPKPETRGLITAELIDALPKGSLVVMVTRSMIYDTDALYRRVLNDELSLAVDVYDVEPLPLDSPLIGRHNVVHTPHNAGRTIHANRAWADDQIARFRPR